MSRTDIEQIQKKYDEAVINEINDWNLDWNHVWMHYNKEQMAQVVTQRVSHVLDHIGATKNGLHYAMEIERALNKKYPFDNSAEKNLERLAERKAIVEKEIDFWKNVQTERANE
jgi:hypothetical protein